MDGKLLNICRAHILAEGEAAVPTFVPPLHRRRLSPLQQRFFVLAHAVTEGLPRDYAMVFASEDGEDSLTRRLTAEYRETGEVSPMRFSTSVYNAAPGLYSILTKNRAPYTAVVAGPETVDCGLLEALLTPGRRLWAQVEETRGGRGAACLMADEGDLPEGASFRARMSAGSPDAEPLTLRKVADFLTGERMALVSRYFALERL